MEHEEGHHEVKQNLRREIERKEIEETRVRKVLSLSVSGFQAAQSCVCE